MQEFLNPSVRQNDGLGFKEIIEDTIKFMSKDLENFLSCYVGRLKNKVTILS
jgi:hypothetical protein